MAERKFLGKDDLLPRLIARNMEQFSSAKLPDFGRFLLVLPGKLARKSLQKELVRLFPAGILPPAMLTPHLLLHFGRESAGNQLFPAAEILIWDRVLAEAVKEKERFPLLFPGGRIPALKTGVGRSLQDFRKELAAGGVSIAQAAFALGPRGRELAALEEIYLDELTLYGYTDTLVADRQAACDTAPFAEVEKIILAGLPDLPRILVEKLTAIDREFPGRIQIWIGDDPQMADFYDQWGIPIAEKWKELHLDIPLSNLHSAVNPTDAARCAMTLAPGGVFNPEECAVVLADQSLYPEFSREFSRLTDTDSRAVTVMDPGGVPVTALRLWPLASALLEVLKNPGDFIAAANLIRQEDFLNFCIGVNGSADQLLIQLDDFRSCCMPDDFANALALAGKKRRWRQLFFALRKIGVWQQRFTRLDPAEFLRKFFTAVCYHAPDSPPEKVSLAQEAAFWKERINEFATLPEKLLSRVEKTAALEAFLVSCREAKIVQTLPPGVLAFEGRLEMPFLTQKRIIFCGMNEEYFPDRIDSTAFLTDDLRREIGIRSNKDTLTRSICHLFSAGNGREKGDLQIIVLRKDAGENALRPSGILFAGSSLLSTELVARCKKLFHDPEALSIAPMPAGKREFTLLPEPLLPMQEETGMFKVNVTDLDAMLRNPFDLFWKRYQKMDEVDYSLADPGSQESGTLCHKAFELLEKGRKYASSGQLEAELRKNFASVLEERFGSPLPVLVQLYAENMNQRLAHGAEKLFELQQEGFELLVSEYKFGGGKNFVPLDGVAYHGKIDRIDIDPIRKIIRLTDIKTGKVSTAEAEHCKINKKSGIPEFSRLQLPAYAVLLKLDPAFRELLPEIDDYRIEAAYLALPAEVSNSDMALWEWEKFEAILPYAREKMMELAAAMQELANGNFPLDPARLHHPMILPDFRTALPEIRWLFDGGSEPEKTIKAALPESRKPFNGVENKDRKPFPPLPPDPGAGKSRCCFCTRKAECDCCNGDCADCKAFNGFKDFSIITASAGTGKTHALASRFIQLLEFGVAPESILAITFTKKAAGEIFDKLIDRFIELITESSKPQNHCRRVPEKRYIQLLRNLLAPNEKTLQISTIDSFFMKLLGAFAPELGIWGEINVIDQDDDRFLRQTLHRWIRSADSSELAGLRELLKEADPENNRSLLTVLYELIAKIYSFYQLNAIRDDRGRVFFNWDPPEAVNSLTLPGEERVLAAAAVIRELAAGQSDAVTARRLEAVAGLLERSASGVIKGTVDKDVKDMLNMFNSKNSPQWLDGEVPESLDYKRAGEFSGKAAEAVYVAFRHIRAAAMLGCIRKNHAVFQLVANYDRIYNDLIRRQGNISFGDLPFLLCSMDKETRELTLGSPDHSLEFRMDSRIDHYMFDEFQDTSDIQYRAFEPLLKELFASCNNSDRFRSFFCVGDIKQSIYQWRYGNPELFNCVAAQLKPVGEAKGYPVGDSLVRSYRTSQAVLDAVNAVFAGYDGEYDVFRCILEKMKFQVHISNYGGRPGHTALIEVNPGSNKDKIAAKAAVIGQIIRHIRPFERQLSVGVLVTTNDNVRDFAALLRQNTGMPVSCEGKVTPADCMAVNVFRQLLLLALHPGDEAALNFFNMLSFDLPGGGKTKLPLTEIIAKLGLPEVLSPAEALRKEIFYNGIGGLALKFTAAFGGDCAVKEQEKLQMLCRIAAKFSGSCEEFLRRIDSLGEDGSCLDGTIQVMTTHKSKGLQFDIVFLPDLSVVNRPGSAVLPKCARIHYSGDEPCSQAAYPEWISYTPVKELCANIPALQEYQENAAEERAFEKACNLYVAMTRAKYALYMLCDPLPKSSNAYAIDRVMRSQLTPFGVQNSDQELYELLGSEELAGSSSELLFTHGQWHWYSMIRPELIEQEKAERSGFIQLPQVKTSPAGIETASGSKKESFTVIPALRFAPYGGAELGTELHKLLENVEFTGADFKVEEILDSVPVSGEAEELFRQVMQEGTPVFDFLRRPEGECEVWKEKRFIRQKAENIIIPGAFDRVVIFRESGVITRAQIVDFKSDRFRKTEDFMVYKEQLFSYRESLASLLDLPEEKITGMICALRLNAVIPVF